jgi:hypothetical protein
VRSASLEGWSPPRESLLLARGSHGLIAPVPAPPAGTFNALTPTGTQVKDESTHAVPLTCLGVISRRCTANPPCTTLCGKASVSSATLCHPLLYSRRAAPSKEDSGTLEGGIDTCSALTQDHAVTSDQWSGSPPSPSALCGHPHRHDAIPGTTAPSPTLLERGATRCQHARRCASYDLPSAAPSSQHTGDDRTEDS